MKIKNLNGPSGVALGGIGCGYYEIAPTGKVTRMCVNNVHKSFVDSPAGMIIAAHDGKNAVRFQRDSDTIYKMGAYANSEYTGLWPTLTIDFANAANKTAAMRFSAYSSAAAHDIKNSAIPAVYYTVTLKNEDVCDREMSALVTWADLIGRGIRDTEKQVPSNLDGESGDWNFIAPPATYAKGIEINGKTATYKGVMQYTQKQILPRKATFQNYNTSFMLLAESKENCEITILKNFDVNDENALCDFVNGGKLSVYDESASVLSGENQGKPNETVSASAVCVKQTVKAGETAEMKFMVTWFMPEISPEQLGAINHMEGCDYNKYYHNFFASAEEVAAYAIDNRGAALNGIHEWQQPILNGSMPDWLKFKLINSGYTLYSNSVLNKRGNYSSLEGEMGGYGGTMDQKMSSHPFYEKMYPELNMNENRQFANVRGKNGEIQHFDLHYYHGISDFNENNKANPTPAGSMIDNAGAWMIQMWNYYRQTGDAQYIQSYYDIMTTSMAFIDSKCTNGTSIPNYNTTYDDYSHPQILIYSGTIYLVMLDIAAQWSNFMGDGEKSERYRQKYALTYADVEKLYGNHFDDLDIGSYYAFGSDYEYISSNKKSGKILSEVMFAGAMAGEFMSRYSGLGDVVPFDHFVSHMSAFLATSVQKSNDYYVPKVFNIRTEQSLDNSGSRCWPFYLDSYGGMAAMTAGFVDDGLAILKHTMEVHLNLGYMWTQNLWNPAYSTYMTTTVSWFIADVLAGSALDVPNGTITLGPKCGSDGGLNVTLYYPKFWAEVNYQPAQNTFTYKIIRTFYSADEKPFSFRYVIAAPAGRAYSCAKKLTLDCEFIAKEGAVLDLSRYIKEFEGCFIEKRLKPVAKYVTPVPEKLATGTGLTAVVYPNQDKNAPVARISGKKLDYHFNKENPPADNIDDKYTLCLSGSLLPRYGQKYQILIEYTGEAPEIMLDGEKIENYGETIDAVESQQFTQTEGCKLIVITKELEAGKFCPIKIDYYGSLNCGENILKVLWWSTTQTMGQIITERLYPEMNECDTTE